MNEDFNCRNRPHGMIVCYKGYAKQAFYISKGQNYNGDIIRKTKRQQAKAPDIGPLPAVFFF